jgi:hypothetical protein
MAAGLTGCAAGHYCSKPIAYQSSPSVPVVQSIGDIKVQPSASAYLVPPAPTSAQQPFGQQVADPQKAGKTHWSCLDQPPPFTPTNAPMNAPAIPPPPPKAS